MGGDCSLECDKRVAMTQWLHSVERRAFAGKVRVTSKGTPVPESDSKKGVFYAVSEGAGAYWEEREENVTGGKQARV